MMKLSTKQQQLLQLRLRLQQQKQQQQQQQRQQQEISLHTVFERLPKIPNSIYRAQCVAFGNEILICGGYDDYHCYSYHMEKRQYKFIGSYPPMDIQLKGHTVVSISSSSVNKNRDGITLLSFGGSSKWWGRISYHTLMMNYQSVWKESECNNETKNSIKNNVPASSSSTINFNQWVPLSHSNVIGANRQLDLEGARALVGGSQSHLLFITHNPENIDVVDLRSFLHLSDLKRNILPVYKKNSVSYHCFLPLNRKRNEFILMIEGQTIFLLYDEKRKEFYYRILTSCFLLRNIRDYAYVRMNRYLFIFGGHNIKTWKCLDRIWMFDIKRERWLQCDIKLPLAIKGAVASVDGRDLSVHIIGGMHQDICQNIHYVKPAYTVKKIENISEYWIRKSEMTRHGWIKEFNHIVLQYLY